MGDGQGSGSKGGLAGTVAAAALLAVSVVTAPTVPVAPPRAVRPTTSVGGPVDTAAMPIDQPATTKTGALGKLDLALQRTRWTAFPIGVVKKFGDDRAGQLAALIAYYGFFSLFPAMLALVTILGFALQGNEDLRQKIADSAISQIPVVGDSIASSSGLTGSTVALIIGLAGALWAGLGMMQAAQDAMNSVWDVARADYPTFIVKRVRSLLMLLLIALLIVASTALAQIAGLVISGAAATVFLFLATVVFNVLVFMVAYRVLTVAKLTWRHVLPGACVGGVAYTIVQAVGSVYINRTVNGASNTYGTFAVVIGLLSWIYLIAQVVLFGAEVNVVANKRLWPRSLFGTATTGDRRSHAAEVEAERMDDRMDVDVDFAPPTSAATPATS